MRDSNDKTRRFAFDRRGVSEVIGAILVFGLLIALLSIIQLYGIPDANQGVEFEHSQAAEQDFSQLRVAMSQTADTGRSHRTSFKVGTTYPSRLMFYNPPPVQGSLRTTDEANITLENVASDSSAGVLFGTSNVHNYTTRSLVYAADYNQLENTATRVQEPTVYYRQFEGRTLVGSSNFVDGSTINIVAIGGNLSANAIDSQTLRTRALSGPASEYQVSNDGSGPITISVPTKLDFEAWNETLRGEYAPNAVIDGTTVVGSSAGRITKLTYSSNPSGYNRVTIELKNGQYELRMAKVGVGSGEDPTPAYLAPDTDGNSSVAAVQVRDAFNNPVSGVKLTAEVTAGSGDITNGTATGSEVTVTSGPDGIGRVSRVTSSVDEVEFYADLNESGTVEGIERHPGFFGSGNVLLNSVSDNSGNDAINLQVQNNGPPRTVDRVQVSYITQIRSQEVAESANLIDTIVGTVVAGINTGQNSNVTDGPDSVTAAGVNGGSETLSSAATEGEGPSTFTSTRPVVPSGLSTVNLYLDESYELQSADAVLFEVTVFYEDGHRETYSGHLFANEA